MIESELLKAFTSMDNDETPDSKSITKEFVLVFTWLRVQLAIYLISGN